MPDSVTRHRGGGIVPGGIITSDGTKLYVVGSNYIARNTVTYTDTQYEISQETFRTPLIGSSQGIGVTNNAVYALSTTGLVKSFTKDTLTFIEDVQDFGAGINDIFVEKIQQTLGIKTSATAFVRKAVTVIESPTRYVFISPTNDKFVVYENEEFTTHAAAGSNEIGIARLEDHWYCLLYTSPSPRDRQKSRMPSSA